MTGMKAQSPIGRLFHARDGGVGGAAFKGRSGLHHRAGRVR